MEFPKTHRTLISSNFDSTPNESMNFTVEYLELYIEGEVIVEAGKFESITSYMGHSLYESDDDYSYVITLVSNEDGDKLEFDEYEVIGFLLNSHEDHRRAAAKSEKYADTEVKIVSDSDDIGHGFSSILRHGGASGEFCAIYSDHQEKLRFVTRVFSNSVEMYKLLRELNSSTNIKESHRERLNELLSEIEGTKHGK